MAEKDTLKMEEDEVNSSHIFVWGSNRNGQLSLDDETMLVPDPIAIRLDQISRIRVVACGQAHALLVSALGVVFTMGDNTFGQLGVPRNQVRSSRQPIKMKQLALKENFSVAEVNCAENSSFASFKALAKEESDELYSWGSTQDGVLGQGN